MGSKRFQLVLSFARTAFAVEKRSLECFEMLLTKAKTSRKVQLGLHVMP